MESKYETKEELENLLVREIINKTWQPKKLAKKINDLYQEKINNLVADIESANLDILRLKMEIKDLKRENIKLKYRDSSKEFCTYRGDSCWAKEPNCECKTFENCTTREEIHKENFIVSECESFKKLELTELDKLRFEISNMLYKNIVESKSWQPIVVADKILSLICNYLKGVIK